MGSALLGGALIQSVLAPAALAGPGDVAGTPKGEIAAEAQGFKVDLVSLAAPLTGLSEQNAPLANASFLSAAALIPAIALPVASPLLKPTARPARFDRAMGGPSNAPSAAAHGKAAVHSTAAPLQRAAASATKVLGSAEPPRESADEAAQTQTYEAAALPGAVNFDGLDAEERRSGDMPVSAEVGLAGNAAAS